MLGRKFCPETAGLARISVCDLEKNGLLSLFRVEIWPRPVAHRLFLCERWQSHIVRIGRPYARSAALLCRIVREFSD